jgi:hypothetical protein
MLRYLVHDGHGGEGHEVLDGVAHQLQREQEGERLVRLPEHRRVSAHQILLHRGKSRDQFPHFNATSLCKNFVGIQCKFVYGKFSS